ncbi:MAG TPA: hypothetical protein VM366_00100 [Anaerolineae bacterium]|nr:hypothetical protein [Anaerolineae bacterium]
MSLDDVKVGDVVGVSNGSGDPDQPAKVVRVTKTQFVVRNNGRDTKFNRRTHRAVGDRSVWSPLRASEWTTKSARRWHAWRDERLIVDYDWRAAPVDLRARVAALIRAEQKASEGGGE